MLKIEPLNDNERENKFSIYLKQCEYLDKNLSLLLQIWDDNKKLFNNKPKECIEKEIINFHSNDNQICPDPQEGEWICYYMAKKLDENALKIEKICKLIPKKLE